METSTVMSSAGYRAARQGPWALRSRGGPGACLGCPDPGPPPPRLPPAAPLQPPGPSCGSGAARGCVGWGGSDSPRPCALRAPRLGVGSPGPARQHPCLPGAFLLSAPWSPWALAAGSWAAACARGCYVRGSSLGAFGKTGPERSSLPRAGSPSCMDTGQGPPAAASLPPLQCGAGRDPWEDPVGSGPAEGILLSQLHTGAWGLAGAHGSASPAAPAASPPSRPGAVAGDESRPHTGKPAPQIPQMSQLSGGKRSSKGCSALNTCGSVLGLPLVGVCVAELCPPAARRCWALCSMPAEGTALAPAQAH